MLVAALAIQTLSIKYEEISDSEIPGRYLQGSVHSSWTINLQADHQFEARSSSCLSRSKTRGTWSIQDKVIVLAPIDQEMNWIGQRFVPIRFNHHLYVIQENSVPAFAEYARRGRREVTPCSSFPIKFDEQVPLPDFAISEKAAWLPPRYRPFLELGPITAKVVKMIDARRAEVELTANYPVLPTIRLGMEGPRSIELQLESINGTKAIAKVWYFANSERRIEAGDEFSSKYSVAPESRTRFSNFLSKRVP